MDVLTGVRDLLEKKDREVLTVPASAHLADCATKMNEAQVGSLLVLSESNDLAGIITYRDLLRAIAEKKDLHRVSVSAEMKTNLHTVAESASLLEAENLMVSKGIRHLPVLRGREVVGIITRIDVLKLHMMRADQLSDELVRYIGGA